MAKPKGRENLGVQQRRSSAELRALLLEAAREAFGENGYATTTNRDVARTAGVTLSVLYRHFDSKADLFSEAVLEPFVRGVEKLGNDWLGQLGEPLEDEELMQVFIRDIYANLTANQTAVDQLLLGQSELTVAMTERLRAAFEKLVTNLRLMTELETDDVIEGMVKLGLFGMTEQLGTGRAGEMLWAWPRFYVPTMADIRVVIHEADGLPYGGDHRGHEGVLRMAGAIVELYGF